MYNHAIYEFPLKTVCKIDENGLRMMFSKSETCFLDANQSKQASGCINSCPEPRKMSEKPWDLPWRGKGYHCVPQPVCSVMFVHPPLPLPTAMPRPVAASHLQEKTGIFQPARTLPWDRW